MERWRRGRRIMAWVENGRENDGEGKKREGGMVRIGRSKYSYLLRHILQQNKVNRTTFVLS